MQFCFFNCLFPTIIIGLFEQFNVKAYKIAFQNEKSYFNNRPVIGILAQETSESLSPYGKSYISASYIKFVEAGGGRPVAIRINQAKDYYKELFTKINGILFPGGNVDPIDSGYGRSAKILYGLAIKENDNGNYFPLWGTCLGFELLTILTSGKNWLANCDSDGITLPLKLSKDFINSRLFGSITKEVYIAVTSKPVTINYHEMCITPKNFSLSNLKSFYRILSTNEDLKGKTFISTFEAIHYPFYGVQWHPEISNFEDQDTLDISHSMAAIRVAQYMANFFTEEARHSSHKFENATKENEALIYNVNPVFIANKDDSTQTYFFND